MNTNIEPRWLFLVATLAIHFGALVCLAGEPQSLQSSRRAGEISHIEVVLEVGGELSLVEEGKVRKLPMSVVGNMIYGERLQAPTAGKSAGPRSVRYYDRADAVIKIDKGELKPALRGERRLIAIAPAQGAATIFSPSGPLARDELDLVDVPGNSLLIEGLLPGEPVAQGDRWQHSDQLMAALLGLDAVNRAEVSSQLVELSDLAAQIEIRGNIQGAVSGVASEMELKGRYKFDRKVGRITWFALLTKEKRSIGHVAPGVDVVARLQMKIAPDAVYAELEDQGLQGVDLNISPERTLLEHESTAGRYRLLYDRQWHIMNDTADSMAMRLVDRGELVAQCNVTTLAPVKQGEPTNLAKFQQDIERSLGKSFRRFLAASQAANESGDRVYRVVAEGEVDELPIQWNYYLVTAPDGRQAVFAFTLESNLVERLGAADSAVVGSLEFTSTPTESAAVPTPAAAQR